MQQSHHLPDDNAAKLNFPRRGFLTSVGVASGGLSHRLLESPAERGQTSPLKPSPTRYGMT